MRMLLILVGLGLCYAADQQQIPNRALKNRILAAHNSARANLVPSAIKGMEPPALKWSDDAAWAAANFMTCPNANAFQHEYHADFGENLAMYTGTLDQKLEAMIKLWVDEQYDYDVTKNFCGAGKVCGHYTQVVWSKTTHVGCGYAYGCNYRGSPQTVLNCYYTPAGNMNGMRPYWPDTMSLPIQPVIQSITKDDNFLTVTFQKGVDSTGKGTNTLKIFTTYKSGGWGSNWFTNPKSPVTINISGKSGVEKYEAELTVGTLSDTKEFVVG